MLLLVLLWLFLSPAVLAVAGMLLGGESARGKPGIIIVAVVVPLSIVWAFRAFFRSPRGSIPPLLGPRMNSFFLQLAGIKQWGPSVATVDRRAGKNVVMSVADLPAVEPV